MAKDVIVLREVAEAWEKIPAQQAS